MTVNQPAPTDFQRTAIQFHRENLIPKVYDIEDHQNFQKWYLEKLHKQLTKSEMDRTRGNFTYDMDYYMSLPNPSKSFEIIEHELIS